MKITIVNLEKKKIKTLDNNTKYVLITNDYTSINEYLGLKIKPILILYSGAYVVDLDNNSVIINKSINVNSLNKISKYCSTHNVDISYYKYDDTIYGLKLMSNNYHRRLIIPYMFSDLYPNVKCNTVSKDIFVSDSKVSLINAIEETLDYLNIKNNYIELENIYINVSDNGYYKNSISMKGYELYEN